MTYVFSFWTTLGTIILKPKDVTQSLDLPLKEAVARARWFTAWTAILLGLGIWLLRFQHGYPSLILQHVRWPAAGTAIVNILAILVFMPLFYGLFRLYTLVTHVITLNVFKTRGQRLRLLNLQTSMLPLSVPLLISMLLGTHYRTLALFLLILVGVASAWMFGYGYNQIFHKHRLQGLLLWVGATLVTWFVLSIGALAVTVAIGVLTFFALLFLRMFKGS